MSSTVWHNDIFKATLTFKSVDRTLVCDHSNKSYQVVLSCGTAYYAVQSGSNFLVCGWNLSVWSFLRNLSSIAFTQYHLFAVGELIPDSKKHIPVGTALDQCLLQFRSVECWWKESLWHSSSSVTPLFATWEQHRVIGHCDQWQSPKKTHTFLQKAGCTEEFTISKTHERTLIHRSYIYASYSTPA